MGGNRSLFDHRNTNNYSTIAAAATALVGQCLGDKEFRPGRVACQGGGGGVQERSMGCPRRYTHTQKEGRIWNVLSAHSPKWVPYPGLDQLVEAMQAWLPNKQRLAHRAQTPLDYLAKKARYRRPPSPDPKHLLGQGARL